MLFSLQDAQNRATERRTLDEVGLSHLAPQLLGVPPSPTPGAQLEPATPGSVTRNRVPLLEAPDTSNPAVRARNALRRWAARERRQRVEQR
jgi:hypothetical protein